MRDERWCHIILEEYCCCIEVHYWAENPAGFADHILMTPRSYPELKKEDFPNHNYHNRNSIFTTDIPGDERKNLQRRPADLFQTLKAGMFFHES